MPQKKIVFIVLLLILLLSTFLVWFLLKSKVATTEEIIVTFSTRTPIIDGKWTTPEEWIDATKTTIEKENHKANIWIKHNQKQIFILLDFITDFTSSTFDQAGICLDTRDDGGALPQKDDYLFSLRGAVNVLEAFQGTEVGDKPEEAWTSSLMPFNTTGSKGYDGNNNPDEQKAHRIYEFQISIQSFPEGTRYGFYVFLCDWHTNYSLIEWPKNAGGNWSKPTMPVATQVPPAPQNWGAIKDHFIPEKFNFALLFVTASASTWLTLKAKNLSRSH